MDLAIVGLAVSFEGGKARDYWRELLRSPRTVAPHQLAGHKVTAEKDADSALALGLKLAREALEDAGGARLPRNSEKISLILDADSPPRLNSRGAIDPGYKIDEHLVESLGLAGVSARVESFSPPLGNLRLAVSELESRVTDTLLVGSVLGQAEAEAEVELTASGCMLTLRRLDDAERDGNRIYAVLKSLCVFENQGQSTKADNLNFGNALRRKYESCDVNPRTVSLMELITNGLRETLEPELKCLTSIFGERIDSLPWCTLGNGARGEIAAVVKIVLALHGLVLPPNNAQRNQFRLDTENSPFYLSESARPWIHGPGTPRRAAIHQLHSGVRCHLILEEYLPSKSEFLPPESPSFLSHVSIWPTELLCFSGEGSEELLSLLKQTLSFLNEHPDSTLDQLASACPRRPLHAHRLAIIARSVTDLENKLNLAIARLEREGRSASWQLREGVTYGRSDETRGLGRIAFTFPGYGSYYQGMFSELCMAFPPVRAWFDSLDAIFDQDNGPKPSQLLFPPPATSSDDTQAVLAHHLHGMRGGAQAGLVASLAMHELLSQLGVRCDVMVGHSNGENAALMASGAMQFKNRAELFRLIRKFTVHDDRIVSTDHLPKGVFLSVGGLDSQLVEQLIAESCGQLYRAMDNCPHQVVLFGAEAEIQKATARTARAGGIAVRLPFDRAYHTALYRSQEETIRSIYNFIDFVVPHTPVYSCVTADQFPKTADAQRTLAIEQWFSCVRFRETIETLYHDGVRTFVEVGPNSTLTGFTRDTLRGRDHLALICDRPQAGGLTQLQHIMAQLFVRGENLNLSYLFKFREIKGIDSTSALTSSDLPTVNHEMSDVPSTETSATTAADQPKNVGTRESGSLFRKSPDGVFDKAGNADELQPPPLTTNEPGNAQLAVFRGHSQLMQQFLEGQKRALGAFVRALDEGALQGSQVDNLQTEFTSQPFLGTPLEVSDNKQYWERVFSIETEPFLLHHAMGRQPLDGTSSISPLPVIPFTVSIEIVAEAARALVGGNKVVVGISNAHAHRWLAVEGETLRLGILAELQLGESATTQQVHVRLFERDAAIKEAQQLAFEATVHIANRYCPRPTPLQPNIAQSVSPSISPTTFYRDFLFHGPFFQCVKRLHYCSQTAVEAELEVSSTHGFVSSSTPLVFQTPLALLDAAGQVIALSTIALGNRNFNVFPVHAANFEQYADPPAAGRQVVCRAIIERTNSMIVEADFDFLDEHGLLFARFRGFQFRNYREEYVSRLLRPQTAETFFSEPFMQKETGLICRTIDQETIDLLKAGGGFWTRILARLALNKNEWQQWQALDSKGERSLQWLIGRVTAKDAVRQWTAQTSGLTLAHAEMEIVTEDEGRPFVRCAKLDALDRIPHISISHTHGQAVSVADASRVGIDIERLDNRRSNDWANAALDTGELAAAGDDAIKLLEFWCAKEAAAKARGTGLRGNPRAWRVTDYSTQSRLVTVAHGDAIGQVALWSEGSSVLAVCRLDYS